MIISSLLAALIGAACAEPKIIKFATLVPDGSTDMNIMHDLAKDITEASQGDVKFKMYPGGVSGEDKDLVKKMRFGELQAAGLTGVGLGEIAPEVRILDAPWLFHNDKEVDLVYKSFDKDLRGALDKGGYVLLGWTELGPVYVFSKNPINSPDDMKKQKMWVWEGDPIAQAAYKAIGVDPIPLSVVDVMSSLQTGLIDAVYAPPKYAVAMQWFTRTKYIYATPMAFSAGAVVMTKKAFDLLSPEEQKALLDVSSRNLKKLNELSRKENDAALASLQKQGLTLSAKPTPDIIGQYQELGKTARRTLVGKLYSEQLLDRVEKALDEFRSGKTKKN
jgi:TRAP-type C4-dicarboxylate transport system substrate-binding protein